jgi:V8-like Glu-specific endopeptidase
MFKKIALASLVLASAASFAQVSFDDFIRQADRSPDSSSLFRPKVIYGDDDRLDWYDIKSEALKTVARSEVALINKSKMQSARDGWIKITAQRYGDEMQMCSSERFVDQPSATFCSGFLAAGDKIITAGHCIQSQSECENTSFVFDFALFDKDYNSSQVPETAVYNCKRLVKQELDRPGHDFAIVQLDRVVTDRQPVKIRRSGKVADNATLNVVGHPHGIPMKSATGKMRSNDQENYFVATLDTYGGNSGSMVLDENTLEVEGILVRGEQDVDYDSNKGCYVSRVCKLDECNGEESTRISLAVPYLDNFFLWESAR